MQALPFYLTYGLSTRCFSLRGVTTATRVSLRATLPQLPNKKAPLLLPRTGEVYLSQAAPSLGTSPETKIIFPAAGEEKGTAHTATSRGQLFIFREPGGTIIILIKGAAAISSTKKHPASIREECKIICY